VGHFHIRQSAIIRKSSTWVCADLSSPKLFYFERNFSMIADQTGASRKPQAASRKPQAASRKPQAASRN
jgi:hypothetical protein